MNVFKLKLSAAIFSMVLVVPMNSFVLAGLVGHWKFDGDLTDSIDGNNGTG